MVAKANIKSAEMGNSTKPWEVHSSSRLALHHMGSILDAEHAAYSMITFTYSDVYHSECLSTIEVMVPSSPLTQMSPVLKLLRGVLFGA
jgi:hypothetical protein